MSMTGIILAAVDCRRHRFVHRRLSWNFRKEIRRGSG